MPRTLERLPTRLVVSLALCAMLTLSGCPDDSQSDTAGTDLGSTDATADANTSDTSANPDTTSTDVTPTDVTSDATLTDTSADTTADSAVSLDSGDDASLDSATDALADDASDMAADSGDSGADDADLGSNSDAADASGEDSGGDANIGPVTVNLSYDFSDGALGWVAAFADYPDGEDEFYELSASIETVPVDLSVRTGYQIEGNNHSDDLFMYLYRQIGPADGLVAGQAYDLEMTIIFGSNVPTGCIGIGGSPGESVYLKAGGFGFAPRVAPDDDMWLRVNFDKGNQATGGDDLSVAGTVGNSQDCESGDGSWEALTKEYTHARSVTPSGGGNLWLAVGTDSGFEGTSSFYYLSVDATLTPITD